MCASQRRDRGSSRVHGTGACNEVTRGAYNNVAQELTRNAHFMIRSLPITSLRGARENCEGLQVCGAVAIFYSCGAVRDEIAHSVRHCEV